MILNLEHFYNFPWTHFLSFGTKSHLWNDHKSRDRGKVANKAFNRFITTQIGKICENLSYVLKDNLCKGAFETNFIGFLKLSSHQERKCNFIRQKL